MNFSPLYTALFLYLYFSSFFPLFSSFFLFFIFPLFRFFTRVRLLCDVDHYKYMYNAERTSEIFLRVVDSFCVCNRRICVCIEIECRINRDSLSDRAQHVEQIPIYIGAEKTRNDVILSKVDHNLEKNWIKQLEKNWIKQQLKNLS